MNTLKPFLEHDMPDMPRWHSGKAAPPAGPAAKGEGLHPKNAESFLKGEKVAIMDTYAPDAQTDPLDGWVESDETVERLVEWREEATY